MKWNDATGVRTAASASERAPRLPVRGFTGIRAAALVLCAAVFLLTTGCISEDREREIGQALASDVNPHLPLIDDPLVNAYLYAIGREIVGVTSRPDLDYQFYIVDSGAVNAFALPGGHIYLTRGLIERAEDGAEFAGVLAHEIGHVAARHGVRKLQRQLRTGSVVNVLYSTIFGGEPALLRDNSLQLANVVWSARHSRRDEREADRLAVKYLMRTGVDPEGIVTLLETLLEEEREEGDASEYSVDWFSTHPLTENRIVETRDYIGELAGEGRAAIQLDLAAFPAFKTLVRHSSPAWSVEPGR